MNAHSREDVEKIFAGVPRSYEIVNHIMTAGLDRRWRTRTAALAASTRGTRLLDVCTGTGEMAVSVAERSERGALVVGTDFSMPMLRMAARKRGAERLSFVMAEARALPFRDGLFDVVTISFATRNLTASRETLLEHIREFHRVLRPGGRLVSLETSQPVSSVLRTLFHWYARFVVPGLGRIISGSKNGYSYLSSTLVRFYEADELAGILNEAGFHRVGFRRMAFGIVAAHEAFKEAER